MTSETSTGSTSSWWSGSILDENVLDRTFAGADCIVHFAARGSVPGSVVEPRRHARPINATGTLCVLEAARLHGVGQVVVASSSSVYGANPNLPMRELDMAPGR